MIDRERTAAEGRATNLPNRRRDALIVFGAALGMRLIFAALTADSYDPDEFVILALSSHFAHGAVPYQDFTFFHPPGILVFFRVLEPLTAVWWPAARLVTLLIDSLTALMVWRIGTIVYGRREALAAGVLYAASPIALLGGVRVGQDPIITALGVAGLLCLLERQSIGSFRTVLMSLCGATPAQRHGATDGATPARRHGATDGSTPARRHGATDGSTPARRHGATDGATPAQRHGATDGATPAQRHGATDGATPARRHGATDGATPAQRHGATDGATPAQRHGATDGAGEATESLGVTLAGVCLGLAIWVKYPALLFVPVYALAAPPRRAVAALAVAMGTVCVAFAPFAGQLGSLLSDSVTWQSSRVHADLPQRVGAVSAFWLLLNPLAGLSVMWGCWMLLTGRRRSQSPPAPAHPGEEPVSRGGWPAPPMWLFVGFMLGVLFVFSAQVYYHYFMIVVPFAALLGAPLLARAGHTITWRPALMLGTLLVLWTVALNIDASRDGLGQLQLSAATDVVRVIDQRTPRSAPILADQFEYAYLSGRVSVLNYFWNMQNKVSVRSLERGLTGAGAVVATGIPENSYPKDFVRYLIRKGYRSVRSHGSTVWLLLTHQRF
jgi:hypothetical protein